MINYNMKSREGKGLCYSLRLGCRLQFTYLAYFVFTKSLRAYWSFVNGVTLLVDMQLAVYHSVITCRLSAKCPYFQLITSYIPGEVKQLF